MTITVRVPIERAMNESLDDVLAESGIPLPPRDGMMRSWFDPKTDLWVFEWISREEMYDPVGHDP